VNPWAWFTLLSKPRIGIPTGIEQNEKGFDVMPVCNLQERIDALLKPLGVLLPKKVVQKHAHGVEADGFGPAELQVNALWVKRIGLPHFQLVDGIGMYVVSAYEPRLLLVPLVSFLFCPSPRLRFPCV
jgi:hypothetical protein